MKPQGFVTLTRPRTILVYISAVFWRVSEKQEKRALASFSCFLTRAKIQLILKATNHVSYLLFNLTKMSIRRFKSISISDDVAYEFRVACHSVIYRKYSAVAILLLDLNVLVVLIK